MKAHNVFQSKQKGTVARVALYLFVLLFVLSTIFVYNIGQQPTKVNTTTKTKPQQTNYAIASTFRTSNISVGPNPSFVGYNQGNKELYVIDDNHRTMRIVDLSGIRPLSTLRFGFDMLPLSFDGIHDTTIVAGSSDSITSTILVLDDTNNSVVENITISGNIEAIADDQVHNEVYVVEEAGEVNGGPQSTVFGINLSSGSITSEINISGIASDIVYDPDNGHLYISTTTNISETNLWGNVTVISTNSTMADTLGNSTVASIHVGAGPADLLYDSQNGNIYVANSLSSSVSVINTTTNTVVNTIPVRVNPVSITLDTDNGEIYVADQSSGDISVINTTTSSFEGIVHIGGSPDSITYNPDNGELYVAENLSLSTDSGPVGIVEEINADDIAHPGGHIGISAPQIDSNISLYIESEITVGGNPVAIAYNPSNDEIYVADSQSGIVSVINTTTGVVEANVVVGFGPSALVYNPNNTELYVVNTNSSNVAVIAENNTVVTTIDVGMQPAGIAYNHENGEIYVTNAGSDTVSVINASTNTVIGTILVGDRPTAIEYDPVNNEIYVADSGSNIVTVINATTNQVIQNISVGDNPTAITIDTNNGNIFVAAESNGTQTTAASSSEATSGVYLIDGTTNQVIAEADIGEGTTTSLTFDPVANEVIAVDTSAGIIDIIDAETDTVVQTQSLVGGSPTAVAYDESTDSVIIATGTSETVVILSGL